MITQSYLDTELTLAKQIYIYYTTRLVDYLGIASYRYGKWYNDSLQLYSLIKFLEEVNITDDGIYIGAYEVTDNSILTTFRRVREYWLTDIDTSYEFGEVNITPTPTYIAPYNSDWKEFTVSISEDNVSTVTLPVSVDIMDKESIHTTVNGISNPDYNSDTELDGYHIIDNILYWHDSNFYNLMSETTIRIQYLQIVG